MTLLAIDDDPLQLVLMKKICASLEYPEIEYLSAATISKGLAMAGQSVVDLVFTDLHLPDGSGFDVLHGVKELNPGISVVVMTAYESASEAVLLLKGGADDYLIKPTKREDLERIILRVNEKFSLLREALLPPADGPAASPAAAGIYYRSDVMANILSIASRAAASSATVLLLGESGTGKELVAKFIHERSRRKGPFIAVNISALPETLAESELFGHRRGAFTGADADRIGRFEEAAGGTLFLDEIGDISLPLQVKLLRTLQFGIIERVGENIARKLNVRIVAATNRDLSVLVASGGFRRDLFYRLNVIEIRLPPLRERKEDISLLVDEFIRRFAARDGKTIKGLSRETFDHLVKQRFPGNVRELENCIERAVVMCRGEYIRLVDLPDVSGENTQADPCESEISGTGYDEAMRTFEWHLISKALEESGGNQSAAARSLGITERHLRSRLGHFEAPGNSV